MTTGIFLLGKDGNLSEMREKPYDSEAILQEILAQHPSLLPGDQINDTDPIRWILVRRETPIPDSELSGGRWSLDHLFLDQDGVPTLVEVKRSSDTRLRREVVGQMLDYAANSVSYWSSEKIQSMFELRCEKEGVEPEKHLLETFDFTEGYEDYWVSVRTNLQIGRLRMIFVADEVPNELKRIVEFLNEQMDPAEVLAVEIRQFVGENQKTLVPRVIGLTSKAQQKKSTIRETKQWDFDSFVTELGQKTGPDEIRIVKEILKWSEKKHLRVWWGKGRKMGSFLPLIDVANQWYPLFSVWTYGAIEIQFQTIKNRPPFSDLSKRKDLLLSLNRIPQIDIPESAVNKRPSFSISMLKKEESLNQFFTIWEKYISEIRGIVNA